MSEVFREVTFFHKTPPPREGGGGPVGWGGVYWAATIHSHQLVMGEGPVGVTGAPEAHRCSGDTGPPCPISGPMGHRGRRCHRGPPASGSVAGAPPPTAGGVVVRPPTRGVAASSGAVPRDNVHGPPPVASGPQHPASQYCPEGSA